MASNDETFFSHARGINTLYADKEGDTVADVRLCLARYGEDVNVVLQKFWEEQPSRRVDSRSDLFAWATTQAPALHGAVHRRSIASDNA